MPHHTSARAGHARPGRDARAVAAGLLLSIALAAFGLVERRELISSGIAGARPYNVFFRLYALYEAPFLVMLAAFCVLAGLVLFAGRRRGAAGGQWGVRLPAPDARTVARLGVLVAVEAFVVWRMVLHGYLLSMDEFTVDFQARIFGALHWRAALPAPWRPFAPALTPIFVNFQASSGTWMSGYLPVYSLLKAPFVMLGAGGLLNPVLAGASIVVLGAVTRQLWPNERWRPWIAVVLLATSAEFIITSASGYSMPAHLLFNLLWLWLYLRGDARSWGAALIVGALALGLHNPFPHALFVTPFLARLFRERRWRRLGSAAAVYGAASVLWLAWLHASSASSTGAGLAGVVARPTTFMLWVQGLSTSLLFTWQAPVLGLLIVAALLQSSRLGAPLEDLAWGLGLTLLFYLCFPATQGHGWGDRYAYHVLGNAVLLGAAGAGVMRSAFGERRSAVVLVGAFATSLALELPLRLANVAAFTRPFAAGARDVHAGSGVVLVHPREVWYGDDLVRNDPFLSDGPVVVNADLLNATGVSVLRGALPGQVRDLGGAELARLGMLPLPERGR